MPRYAAKPVGQKIGSAIEVRLGRYNKTPAVAANASVLPLTALTSAAQTIRTGITQPDVPRNLVVVGNSNAPGLQAETATVVGTILNPVLQVETATVAGAIEAAGAGDAKVTVTSALFETPVEVAVAVANNDNADAVAGKIRTALGLDADITAAFTIGGQTDKVILTAKAAAANDTTLNIAIDNDTSAGLTAAPNSANTTAGVANGAGNASVVVTSAALTGSPLTVPVAVAANDNANAVAGKIRTALGLVAAIVAAFTVGGQNADVILTAKVADANDATFNIAIDNGTCLGLTAAPTSANTTAGAEAKAVGNVVITGKDAAGVAITETIALNGTTPVVGNLAFAIVSQIVLPIMVSGPSVSVGVGSKLGLDHCMLVDNVLRTVFGGTTEGVPPTVTADIDEVAKNTVTLNSAIDGTSPVDIYYMIG